MMVIMMIMMMVIIGEIYELNMTARRSRASDCCHYIQGHEGEFIDEQEAKSEKWEVEGPGQWGD